MDILTNTDDLTYDVSMLWATEHCFMHVRHAKQLELLASMKPLLDDDESFALLTSAAVTMQRFEHNLRSFDDAAAKAEMQVLLQHPVMDAMGTYLLNQTPKKIEKFVEKIKTVGGIEEVLQAGATDCGQFRNPNECNTDSYCEWKQNKCRARREPYTDTKKRFIFRSIMLAGILLFALFTYFADQNIQQTITEFLKSIEPHNQIYRTWDKHKEAARDIGEIAMGGIGALVGAGISILLGVVAWPLTAVGVIGGVWSTETIVGTVSTLLGGDAVLYLALANIFQATYLKCIVWFGDFLQDSVHVFTLKQKVGRNIRKINDFLLENNVKNAIVAIAGGYVSVNTHFIGVAMSMVAAFVVALQLFATLFGGLFVKALLSVLKPILSLGSSAWNYATNPTQIPAITDAPTQQRPGIISHAQSLEVPTAPALYTRTPTAPQVDCTTPGPGKKKLLKNDCTSRTGCTWVLEKAPGKKRQGKCKQEDGIGNLIENPNYAVAPAPALDPAPAAAPAPATDPAPNPRRSNRVATARRAAAAASDDFV